MRPSAAGVEDIFNVLTLSYRCMRPSAAGVEDIFNVLT
jgi:hypothetical protein